MTGWERHFLTSDTNSQYISTFTFQSDAGVSVWLIERLSAAPDEQDTNSTIIRFRDGTEQYINKASGELALSDLIIRGLKTDKDSWVIQPVSVTIGGNISSIGEDTFSYSTALRNITFGKKVEHIGPSAFYNIPQIRSLELPSGIKKLSDGAFSECDNLLDVNIPSSLMVCEKDVFKGCKNLNSVTLEDGLPIIGETMFDGCTSLTTVQIPHSVASIGESAFVNHNPNIVVYF